MAERITVTSADLRETATQVRTTGESVKSQLDAMFSKVQALLGSSWTGQAAGSFDAFYQEANKGWAQVQTAMEGVAQMVNGAADSYDATETGIAGQFK